ncbi:MAG: pyridoxal phosphate-dependent aminotransferase [Bacteroidota bacterium]
MAVITSRRLQGVGEYYFARKLQEIEMLRKEGRSILNLGIGSPDLPPHPDVIEALTDAAQKPDRHAYPPYRGIPLLRQAMSDWYQQWYSVALDPETEILPLMGSKEGILHLCMTYLNPGDRVLVPDPGYPSYASAVRLAGAKPITYSLTEKNQYEPDWDRLEQLDLTRVKLFFVNYPQMPTGHSGSRELFARLVDFARRKNLLLVHDNPYSFILQEKPLSLLSIPGANEVAVELNSLSKSHNMAGWRVGMLCGQAKYLNDVIRFRSNMDSGFFIPIQLAAVKALQLTPSWYESMNAIYRARQKKVFELLRSIGCRFLANQSGLFVWAKAPSKWGNKVFEAHEWGRGGWFSDVLLNEVGLFLTPGGIFGKQGKPYIRISLCSNETIFNEAIERIEKTQNS